MRGVISIDGAIVPPERAVVSVLDRGFLYGDGLFESLRVYAGRPFAREEHVARLARSAAAIGIVLPVPEAQLVAEIDAAARASGFAEAYVRITVTRGATDEPSLVAPAGLRATRVILVAPLRTPPAAVYRDGLRACTVAWSRGPDGGPASTVKLLSYVPSLLALEQARTRGADEAIFVGIRRGRPGRGYVERSRLEHGRHPGHAVGRPRCHRRHHSRSRPRPRGDDGPALLPPAPHARGPDRGARGLPDVEHSRNRECRTRQRTPGRLGSARRNGARAPPRLPPARGRFRPSSLGVNASTIPPTSRSRLRRSRPSRPVAAPRPGRSPAPARRP